MKTIILAITLLLAGCGVDSREVVLSPAFGVCAGLSRSESYELNRAPIVDFDDGELLTADGRRLAVYVGMNPDFPRAQRSVPGQIDHAFSLSGVDNVGAQKKILLAQRRSDRDVVYVMVSAANLSQDDVSRWRTPRAVYQCKVR
jgi:hypothetical protein